MARQVFIEFGEPFPGVVPLGRAFAVRIEAKLAHKSEWTPLVTFTLRAQRIISPTRYIAYSNADVPLSADEIRKSEEAAKALLEHMSSYS